MAFVLIERTASGEFFTFARLAALWYNEESTIGERRVKLSRPALVAVAGLVAAVMATVGLTRSQPVKVKAHSNIPAPARRAARLVKQLRPPLPPAQLAALHADEAGHIPILMYHAIGAPARKGVRYDTQGLNIAPETFRKQLALMYAAHWRPVNMRDVLTAHIDVPAGMTPVVLTFDDARGTQFHYLPDGDD